jgi:hypothetical protein
MPIIASETRMAGDRENDLANAMLGELAKVVEGYNDTEIFTALIILLCNRMAREADPAVPARRVIATLEVNFLPEGGTH